MSRRVTREELAQMGLSFRTYNALMNNYYDSDPNRYKAMMQPDEHSALNQMLDWYSNLQDDYRLLGIGKVGFEELNNITGSNYHVRQHKTCPHCHKAI